MRGKSAVEVPDSCRSNVHVRTTTTTTDATTTATATAAATATATATTLRHDVNAHRAHVDCIVFYSFHRLQRPKPSVAPVFAASGFARFRKWRTHRYLHGVLCFLLFERTPDMASSDKDSSLICSLILERVL